MKIICTISPKTEKLHGIDVCRINCSFGTKEEISSLARRIKDEWGCRLLLDLPTHRKKKRTNNLSFDDLIGLAKQISPDYAALSYVRSHSDVLAFKKCLNEAEIKIVAKIETAEALEDLDRIISAADMIMIDRGDLASVIGIGKLLRAQKRIVQKCNQMGKRVIVATEFLLSMVDKSVPTKSEVVDIANAISDGADYLMLSEETAIGHYSQHAVNVIQEIVCELEDRYKILLLSAGPSLAMGSLTATHHTALIDVGGVTILETQLNAFRRCSIYDDDIIIATGKGHELIRDFVIHKLKRADVNYVYNPWYESSNMLITLWLAREYLRKGFVVVYGDIVFDAEILKKIIKNKDEIVLGVDKKVCDEEDEKICVKNNRMVLSRDYHDLPFPKHKCIPIHEAYGEFIGIAKFNRWGAAILINEMERIISQGNNWSYLMEAFEHLVQQGQILSVETISGLFWNDNDTIHDLNVTKKNIARIR